MSLSNKDFYFSPIEARIIAVMVTMRHTLEKNHFFLAEICNHYDSGLKENEESPASYEFDVCLKSLQKKGVVFWHPNTINPSYTPGTWSLCADPEVRNPVIEGEVLSLRVDVEEDSEGVWGYKLFQYTKLEMRNIKYFVTKKRLLTQRDGFESEEDALAAAHRWMSVTTLAFQEGDRVDR